jgi:hypothetical protein
MMDEPVFDEALRIELEGNVFDLVTHRDFNGTVIAVHSPLTDGAVKCSICETPGTRVYIR